MDGLIKKITSGPTPAVPSHYSEDWKSVVRWMLSKDEDQRPTAEDILKLPWLQVWRRKEGSAGVGRLKVPEAWMGWLESWKVPEAWVG